MHLGEQISRYRKELGISQEELGARLDVSRQAVSKWETGVASPDMENLLALAREFGVSVAELTATPEAAPPAQEVPPSPPPRRKSTGWWVAFGVVLALLIAMTGGMIYAIVRSYDGQVSDTPESFPPESEFVLQWEEDRFTEWLALGKQSAPFPFGTSLELSEAEIVTDSGFSGDTYHDVVCDTLSLRYSVVEDPAGSGTEIFLRMVETSSPRYVTSQSIQVGSPADDVPWAYDEADLLYCTGGCGPETDLPYEACYVYCPSDPEDPAFGWNLIFLLSGDSVCGIRMEDASYPYYHVNNRDTFPVKDGAPDFSNREDPPQNTEQQVYDALNNLVTRDDLTAEERYVDRWTIFSSLSDLDWWAFGDLGTTEAPEDTINALLSWLLEQEPYTDSEIFRIQLGVQSNLDGWLTDSYAHLLSTAFFSDPAAFAKNLAYPGLEEAMYDVVDLTAYDAELYPSELETALSALAEGTFTEEEAGWAKLLRLYLVTPIDERSELPRTPADLSA